MHHGNRKSIGLSKEQQLAHISTLVLGMTSDERYQAVQVAHNQRRPDLADMLYEFGLLGIDRALQDFQDGKEIIPENTALAEMGEEARQGADAMSWCAETGPSI